MRIIVLNGNPDDNNTRFDSYIQDLADSLELNKHTVSILVLREMDMRYCIGCFGCWIKTPGECSNAADDTRTIRYEFINSDFVIFASPVKMGFTSALLKKAHDKLIPLLMPYVEFYHSEAHHVSRYDKYPLIALLLENDNESDAEDIKIISEIYRRDALNFKTTFCFTKLTDDPIDEVVDAVNCI